MVAGTQWKRPKIDEEACIDLYWKANDADESVDKKDAYKFKLTNENELSDLTTYVQSMKHGEEAHFRVLKVCFLLESSMP